MDKKPRLSSLTFLGFYVNAAIEDGHGEKITFDDIYKGLESGSLLEDLQTKIPGVFDFSLFAPRSEQREGLFEALESAAGGLKGRERRKVGVKKNGLSLLMALILEAIQQGF